MANVTCDCATGKKSFINLGTTENQWWVHAACGKPMRAWLTARGVSMLNYFRGGPLDGTAYSTETMLDAEAGGPGWTAQLAEYKWTPDIIISEKTGASARVWLHQSLAPAEEPAPETPDPQAEGQATADVGPTESATHEEVAIMAEQTLEDRRKALKLSRKQVSVKSGVSEAKVARIEKQGERTTEEEIKTLSDALDALEKESASDPS